MPVIIGVILVLLAGFQLFFRYENWTSKQQDGVVYERDKLTGETHIIRPGEPVDFLGRLTGHYGHSLRQTHASIAQRPPHPRPSHDGQPSEAYQMNMTNNTQHDTTDKLAQDTDELDKVDLSAEEGNNAPEPRLKRHLDRHRDNDPQQVGQVGTEPESYEISSHTVSRQFDLNQDGHPEQIIQSVNSADGILSISVVHQGKEVFFGRGRQLQILPTRRLGWADLALVSENTRTKGIYHYSPKTQQYNLVETQPVTASSQDTNQG